MLDRGIETTRIPEKDIKQFSDLNKGKWYYADIVEAANGHEYEKILVEKPVRKNAIWTLVKDQREKQFAKKNK